MAFTLSSTAFREGEAIPKQFTCEGGDSIPPLAVSEPPEGTRSFVLIMDDPDAPGGTFTHWLAYDIPSRGSDLDTNAGKSLQNSFRRQGYGGPCPPYGHGPHRYFFRLYAVDLPALRLAGDRREDLETALAPHKLGEAQMMGTYERRK